MNLYECVIDNLFSRISSWQLSCMKFKTVVSLLLIHRLFLFSPNFFVLDEPTNHLDMETIEALGKALKKFMVGV